MSSHFDKERDLQRRIDASAGEAVPGIDVLDVELDSAREVVRIFVDHPNGVDHELCSRVTKAIRDDVERYSVEVSSPGGERPLRRTEHFAAVVGSQVRMRRRGDKRAFVATLVGTDSDSILVQRADGEHARIALNDVVRAHLAPGQTPGTAASTTGRGSA